MLTDEGWEFTQSCSSSPLRNNQSLAFILLCISSFVKYLSFTARFVRPLNRLLAAALLELLCNRLLRKFIKTSKGRKFLVRLRKFS